MSLSQFTPTNSSFATQEDVLVGNMRTCPDRRKRIGPQSILSLLCLFAPGLLFAQDPLEADDARLIYGNKTASTDKPKVRTWDNSTSSWSAADSALAAGDTIFWVVNEANPTDSTEELAGLLSKVQTTGTDFDLLRLKSGSWSVEWSATGIANSHADKRGFDIAFEHGSGHALVVYSNNTANPVYRTWNGSVWGSETDVFATAPGAGVVFWVELTCRPSTDEIALVYADAQADLFAVIWDGTQWLSASMDTLETNLKTNPLSGLVHNRIFDAAYEETSGDLVVAWGHGSLTGFHYSTKAAGSDTWSAATRVSSAPGGGLVHFVDLASAPEGDRIAGIFLDLGDGTERLGLATWDGGSWNNPGEYDSQIRNVNDTATGDFPGGVGWLGCGGVAVAVYADNQTGTLDYATWTVAGGWQVRTDFTVSGKGYTESVQLQHFPRLQKLLAVFTDSNGDMRAATFDGADWALTNGGAALETEMSSDQGVAFGLGVLPHISGLTCVAEEFIDITSDAGLSGISGSYAVSWGDFHNDGYPDLWVGGDDVLYSNDRDGTFSPGPSLSGGGRAGHWGDYNNDGNLDFFASNDIHLHLNNGDSTFTLQNNGAAGLTGPTNLGDVGWIDYNEDGLLDIWAPDGYQGNYIFHNDGDSTFTARGPDSLGLTPSSNGETTLMGDYDGDGHTDILYRSTAVQLWKSNGDGTFTNTTSGAGISLSGTSGGYNGTAWGDYNNDGDLDLYGGQGGSNKLYENNGDGTFTDVTSSAGVAGPSATTRGVSWGDYDNDGDLDLYVAHSDGANNLFHNNGDGTFTDKAFLLGLDYGSGSYGATWADFDLDGDLDLFLGNSSSSSRLYRNELTSTEYLKVKVTGLGAEAAPVDGTGSQVELWDSTGTVLHAVREVSGGEGMGSHTPHIVHFGLASSWGGSTGKYQVKVRLTSGRVASRYGVAPSSESITVGPTTLDQTIEVVEPGTFTKLQILLPGEAADPGSQTGKTGSPSTQTAGTTFSVTVNAVDADWYLVNTVTDVVAITSTDANAGLPADAALVAGTQTFACTLNIAGSWTITASDTTDPGKTPDTSPAVTVDAGSFTKLQILAPGETAVPGTPAGKTGSPSAQTVGNPFHATVNAVDDNWNLVSTVTDVVSITSTDANAGLPSDGALVAGTQTFACTLNTAGSWTVTASDTTDPGKNPDTSPSITVGAGTFTRLQILVPGETADPGSPTGKTGSPGAQTAGSASSFTVNAVDANWNLVNTITDVVEITSTDMNATLHPAAALASGTRSFPATPNTAGSWTVTASDTTDSGKTPDTSPSIMVGAGSFTKLQTLVPGETADPGSPTGKTGSPSAQTAGSTFVVTVNAVDTNWNLVSAVTDVVTITSTDGNAGLPAEAALVAGTHSFACTLNTAGSWTMTASDTTDPGKSLDTSPAITVDAGSFTKLQILAPGETAAPGTPAGKTGAPEGQTAGEAFIVAVNAVDDMWNLIDTVAHVVRVTSTDESALLPAENPLAAGKQCFPITLNTSGTWTVTSSDNTDTSKVDGTTPPIQVGVGSFVKLQILVPGETAAPGTPTGKSGTPDTATAGSPFIVTVNAVDDYWNVMSGVNDVVCLTSSDSGAIVPPGSPLVDGAGIFPVTLTTAGARTITASDTTDADKGDDTSQPIRVLHDTLHHFEVDSIGNPQIVAVPFGVTVKARDVYGNPVTDYDGIVTLTTTAGDITPDTLDSFVSGVRTENAIVTLAGAERRITVDDGLGRLTTSNAFDVTAGMNVELVFFTQPGDGVAGTALSVQPAVELRDNFGNRVTSWNGIVDIALQSNPSGGSLGGTTRIGAVEGLAAFTDLVIEEVGSGYTLIATSGELDPATSETFNVTAGAPHSIVLVSGDGQSGVVNDPLSEPLVVRVLDVGSNPVPGTEVLFYVVEQPAGAVDARADPTEVLTDSSGEALTSMTLGSKAGLYIIKATHASLPESEGVFTVEAASSEPAYLVFTVEPGDGAGGMPLSSQPEVEIRDSGGNLVVTNLIEVSVAIGNNPGEGSLSGTNTVTATGGVVAFTDLAIDRVGAGYTLVATASGLGAATSLPFDVTLGLARQLLFSREPGDGQGGGSLSPQPAVLVGDAGGNLVATTEAIVSLGFAENPTGAKLLGTISVETEQGVADFQDIGLDKIGEGYRLLTSAPHLEGAISESFDITAGDLAELVLVSGDEQTGLAGTNLNRPFDVRALDAGANALTGVSITFSILTAPAGASGQELSVTGAVTGEDGGASTLLRLGDTEGTYRVVANLGNPPVDTVTFSAFALGLDGTGSATIVPSATYAAVVTDVSITVIGDGRSTNDRVIVEIPSDWDWTGWPADVALEGSGFSGAAFTIGGDGSEEDPYTIFVTEAAVTNEAEGTVVLRSLVAPPSSGTFTFAVRTAAVGGGSPSALENAAAITVRRIVIGDANMDGDVDILDVLWVVDLILDPDSKSDASHLASDVYPEHASLGDEPSPDGKVDSLDLKHILNAILSGYWDDGLSLGATQDSSRSRASDSPTVVSAGHIDTDKSAGDTALVVFEVYDQYVWTRLESPVPIRGLQFDLPLSAGDETPGDIVAFEETGFMEVSELILEDRHRMLLFSRENRPIEAGDRYLFRIPGGPAVYDSTKAIVLAGGAENKAITVNQKWVRHREVPGTFWLAQNRPNPFFFSTSIRFQLPAADHVQIYVYDVRGRKIRRLADEQYGPGFHTVEWDGLTDRGRTVGSGIYFCRVYTARFEDSKRMVFLK